MLTLNTIIIYVIWPLLFVLSIMVFLKGLSTYKLIKNSLIGKIIKAFVYTLLVNISSLGTISVLYLFAEPDGVFLVLGVFIVWFIIFLWSLKIIEEAEKETKKITGQ